MKIKAYKRPDGSFGIRNKVLIISTVGCANETAKKIAQRLPSATLIPNSKGCGQLIYSADIMKRTLTGLILNPNVYGAMIIGLGCETIQPHDLFKIVKKQTDKPLKVLVIQEEGGTTKTIQKGVNIISKMIKDMNKLKREPTDISSLILATNCGGSDATSGLSANPVVGECSNRLIAENGSVIFGETTELIGTEYILGQRAKNNTVKNNIVKIIEGLENKLKNIGVDIRGANPSPGNIRGGLSTLEEKSLGGISKGGNNIINEVVPYGVKPKEKGLILMDTPGYDIESVTGMTAGGAQLCLFTTGRGTPIGNPIIPVIKITGNIKTYENMRDNIDINVSEILNGSTTFKECSDNLFNKIIDVCNGELTKSEIYNFHEISIYHNYEIWCTCI
ncbi:UxaA family hydrolase [Pectinatus frisingensis]|uniref:UxaA family hydrolase n=1 Tax=Pectinatus frisingensis TaxID=865 RepID=UPI003D809070